MTKFRPKGPPRYAHQRRGLMKMIETKGVAALLFDPGTGKGLSLDTEIPTPEGWTTMGALVTGDRVFAPDGSTVEIIAHEPYEAESFRLTFSDGTEVIADGDHLWVTDDLQARRRARYHGSEVETRVRTTRDLVATLESSGRPNHAVRLTAPVEGPERPWLVNPYTLGVWLGDGASNVGQVYSGQEDLEALLGLLRADGEHPRVLATDDNGVTTIAFDRPSQTSCARGHEGQPFKNCPVCSQLRYRAEKYGEPLPPRTNSTLGARLAQLGLRNNKHVPLEYLRASVADRRALLAGLMDTDGHAGRTNVEFVSSRKVLAEAVYELAASLGEKPSIRESASTFEGREVNRKWRVTWTPIAVAPFRIPRKIEATGIRQKRAVRYLVAAEPVGVQTVRCLTVMSASREYLVTRSWLPTHNTMTALDYCSILALKAPPDDAGVREIRVLVTAPLAAVDTWVDQAEKYVSDDVYLWAEALGPKTSIRQKAEVLASRGGSPFKNQSKTRKKHGLRGIHFDKSIMIATRGGVPGKSPADGPDMLGTDKPRLVIEVVNLDTFSSRQPVGQTSSSTLADVMLDAVKRFKPDLVIVDESHKIKGANSNVSRMLARIGRHVQRRVILTGTVMPVGPTDVFGQWRFLDPYAFGEPAADGTPRQASYNGFVRRYAEMGGYLGRQVIGYKHLDELQRIMSINAEVAKKSDALDLPPTTPVVVRVDLTPAEQKAYDEMKKGLAYKLSTGLHASASNRLSQMMRLRQITSGFLPDDLGNLHILGDSKARIIDSIVHDQLAGEKRVVVFALFLHEIEILRKKLEREGTEIMVIHGNVDAAERKRLRLRFGDRSIDQRIVLIAQVSTMSLSVNELVTASNAVYGSLPTKRDDFIQSQDRLDRIGQELPVTFWFALVPGSIDEVIYKAHKTRQNLEAAVLRHILDGEDNVLATREANAARREEGEQDEQVGRLMDRGDGVLVRYYGPDKIEALDEDDERNSPEAIAARKAESEKRAADAQQRAIRN